MSARSSCRPSGTRAAAQESTAKGLRQQQTEFENLQHDVGARFAPLARTLGEARIVASRVAAESVRHGVAGELIDFLSAGGGGGLGVQRGLKIAGFKGPAELPAPGQEAAINGPSGTEKTLGDIANNTAETAKNTRTILRGGSPAAQGAVSIRELNQALGTR